MGYFVLVLSKQNKHIQRVYTPIDKSRGTNAHAVDYSNIENANKNPAQKNERD